MLVWLMDVVGSNLKEGGYQIHTRTKTLKGVPLGGGGVLISTAHPPMGRLAIHYARFWKKKKESKEKWNRRKEYTVFCTFNSLI